MLNETCANFSTMVTIASSVSGVFVYVLASLVFSFVATWLLLKD